MRVAMDCSHHLIPGGIRTYIEGLVSAMIEVEPENEYIFYYRRMKAPHESIPVPPDARVRTAFTRAPRRPFAWLENHLGWPTIEPWTGPVDVVHGVHLTLPISRTASQVLTVHDLTTLRYPEFSQNRARERYLFGEVLGHSLRRADRVLSISQSTRVDVEHFFGFSRERIWVVPSGADPRFFQEGEEVYRPVLKRLGIDRPYAVYPIGTFHPRKNLTRTLQAFLRAFPGNDRPLLVFTGPHGTSPEFRAQVDNLGLTKDFLAIKLAYPDELRAVLNGAMWGLYPSCYEGFGLPVLEGMACGLPMLVSNVSSVPEVAGQAALQVDPLDVDAIAAGMLRLHEDSLLTADLRQRGLRRARSEAFSWRRVARQTLAVYRGDRAAYEREARLLDDFAEDSSPIASA